MKRSLSCLICTLFLSVRYASWSTQKGKRKGVQLRKSRKKSLIWGKILQSRWKQDYRWLMLILMLIWDESFPREKSGERWRWRSQNISKGSGSDLSAKRKYVSVRPEAERQYDTAGSSAGFICLQQTRARTQSFFKREIHRRLTTKGLAKVSHRAKTQKSYQSK